MIDEELAFLMKQTGFKTIRLSLETVNPERQKTTGGKVTSWEVERAIRYLKKASIQPQDIGIYLMYGLPGQSLQEVWESVRFVMSLKVRVHLAEYSPVPGTVEWENLIKQGVISREIDPILTNNTVFPLLFSGYTEQQIRQLKDEVLKYNRTIIKSYSPSSSI